MSTAIKMYDTTGKEIHGKSKILTPEFRVSYNFIWNPKKDDNKDRLIWSVQAMFPKKTDLGIMLALAKAVKEDFFGEKADKIKLKVFTDGEDMTSFADHPEYENMKICQFKSYGSPVEVLLPNKQKIETEEQKSLFYSGCWARASITAFAYDGAKQKGATHSNKGISFSLQGLMKTRDDVPLVNVRNVENDFKTVDPIVEDNEGEFSEDDEDDEV